MKEKCSVENCEKEVSYKTKRLCRVHYNMERSATREFSEMTCKTEGCSRPVTCGKRSLCRRCYQSWFLTENPETDRCPISGCERPATHKGLCNIHYKSKDGTRPVFKRRKKQSLEPRRITEQGYARIRVFDFEGRSTWPLEHRHVMEQKIGRPLLDGENVHHIDGDKTNNSPENLELWIKPQPQGIRASDAVAWAREIIARYG